MHLRFLLAASAASLSLACGLAAPAFAQETTSAISGQVTDASGSPVAAARVTVTHQPSGTVSVATTDAGGNYSLRGLRVGGPYQVTVQRAEYVATTVDGIQLSVGDTLSLPVQLAGSVIVVTGARTRARELVTGSQSAFNSEDIANTVSARRDIRDVIRKDLLSTYNANVGGVSIAGGNIRTQRFSIDGVQLQDSFGLNYGGLPSTRGIVSLDAIDQITVKAAPFDVSEGNFQGGAVNVVLKSGTNALHGDVFGNWGGPKLTGNYTRATRDPLGNDFPVGKSVILKFRNYGASLSGPLIKDKLFLSLAYEHLEEGTPNPYGLQDSQASILVPNAFRADQTAFKGLDSILSTFTSAYGDFPVGDVPTALNETDKKYSAKIDWNIAPGQRFSASYIYHQNSLPNYGAAGSNNTSTPYLAVQSDLYALTELTKAGSAQLNSQWTDKFSTELRASYKYYRRGQDAFSGPDFAQFNVCADNSSSALGATAPTADETQCNVGVPIYRLGPDTPRQANKFNNHILTFQGNATYRAGAHTLRLEYDNAFSKLYNLFVYGTNSTNSTTVGTGGPQGLYYFDSFADFASRRANELVLNSTTTGDKNDGYVRWGYTTHTLALQDTWRIDPTLTINAGVRYDLIRADQTIALNQNFRNRFGKIYPGLTNTATLNGRDKVQPRFGFNWSPQPSLRVSGGAGLFEGGLSDVFISNNYSNSGAALNPTGAVITGIDLARLANGGCIERVTRTNPGPAVCSALDNVDGATPNAAALAFLQGNTAVLANATTNSLDPGFKLPAQWKYDVNFTWRPDLGESWLAKGWTLRGDVLISQAQDAIRWIDLRAQPLVIGGVTQVAPDGRPRYGGTFQGVPTTSNPTGVYSPGSNQDIQLTNTKKGMARIFAVGLEKSFDFIDISGGYTRQRVKDVAGILVSSTVGSSYSVVTSDPNSGGDYGRSVFEVRDTYRVEADFHHKFFGDAETRFGVAWNLRSGVPWSATMFDNTNNASSSRANVFGTTNTSAHLLYVPDFGQTAVGNVNFYVNGSSAVTAGGIQVGNVIFANSFNSNGTINQTAQQTLDQLKALVLGTKLNKYQGAISPKNLLTGPKYSKIDLSFAQDIPFLHGSRFTFLASIENFLNLLDRKWGSYQEFGNTAVVRVSCASTTPTPGAQACPLYQYSVFSDPKTTPGTNGIKASLYTIRLGARFSF